MPIRWDDRARTILLLKLIEQNPNILSSTNADAIAAKWPGPIKPTGRAITEQIKVLKKESGIPATPSAKRVTSSVPRTPNTPTAIKTPSTKRSSTSAHSGSILKKRKVSGGKKRKVSDDESEEEPVLSSSADDDNAEVNDEETDDESASLSRIHAARTKRKLPTRSKSRNKSYVTEADSAGEDDGAKAPCSDDDETFSLAAMDQEKGKGKTKLKIGKLAIEKEPADQSVEAEPEKDMDEEAGDEQDCEPESDEESLAATSYYSVQDYVV